MPAKPSKKQKEKPAKEKKTLKDYSNQELNNMSLDEVTELYAQTLLKNLKKKFGNN